MDTFLAILLFAFSTTITPGPNNVMIMTSGVNFGVRASLPHLMGISMGFPLMVLFIGLGLGSIFQQLPMLHDVIQIAGIVYLLYLSWQIAYSASLSKGEQQAKPFSFFKAALFQWVNPKAWIMATGAVATYTTLDDQFIYDVLAIASAYLFMAIPCVGAWLLFGKHIKRFLQSQHHLIWFNRTMALLLVISIAPSALEVIHIYS